MSEDNGIPGPKLMSMRDAVTRFVPDGASVCMGTAVEVLIPFAAGNELIREGRRTNWQRPSVSRAE